MTVVPGSPAQGVLNPGDQLVSVAGAVAPSSSDLGPSVIDEIAKQLPGQPIALTIIRDAVQRVVNVTLSSVANPSYSTAFAPTPGYLGVQVATLTPGLAQEYGLPVSVGAYVEKVESGSPSESAGLQSGDVITSVGTTRVRSATDLIDAALQLSPGTTVQVAYTDTNGNAQTVNIQVGTFPSGEIAPLVTGL